MRFAMPPTNYRLMLYKVIRYLTMNDHQRPFPFTDWPEALEAPEEKEID